MLISSFRLSSFFALEMTFRVFHLSVHNHKLYPGACRRPIEGISLFQALCWHPAVSIPFLFPRVSHRASQVEIMPRTPLLCTCFPFCFFITASWRPGYSLTYSSLHWTALNTCFMYSNPGSCLFLSMSWIIFKLSANIQLHSPSYSCHSLYVRREGSFYC